MWGENIFWLVNPTKRLSNCQCGHLFPLGRETGLPGLGDQNVSSYGCPALPLPHDPRALLEVRWKLIKLATFSVMWPNLRLWRLKKILSCIERSERRQHSCLGFQKKDKDKSALCDKGCEQMGLMLSCGTWCGLRKTSSMPYGKPGVDQRQSRSIHATPKSELEPFFVGYDVWGVLEVPCAHPPPISSSWETGRFCPCAEGSSTSETSYLPTLLEERVREP